MSARTLLPAIVVGAAGVLLAIVLGFTLAGDARIVAVATTLALTAFAVSLTIYFTERRAVPPATRTTEAATRVLPEPEATPLAPPETEETFTPRQAVVTMSEAPTEEPRYYDFRGDVHDVIDIEGVGPIYAERLQKIGIETTARLCYEDAATVADLIDVPVRTVQKWQAMGELAKVKGIGKQYAEVLVRAGIGGIDALKAGDPDTIAAQVTDYLATLQNNVLGQNVTAKRVAGWQTEARKMRRVRQTVPAA